MRNAGIPDLRGQRFGAFVVVRDSQAESGLSTRLVACRCDCGNDYQVEAGVLIKRKIQACGRSGCKERRRQLAVS